MNPEDPRIEVLFNAARELKNPEARARYLNAACGNDPVLLRHIESMLQTEEAARQFFDDPRLPNVPITQADSEEIKPLETTTHEGPGTQIGRYKLLQQIGEGGMGVVYMAEQEVPVRRRVALKIIKLGMDTRQVVARFEAERQALALMDHPNIARVLDGGTTDSGRPYFVMELVQGVPITEFCNRARLPARKRLELFMEVCHAIQSAHQKGIIHRDIKPSNVLVTLNDGKPHPMVIDFGIAKATNQKLTEKTLFTNFASMIGTPAYMSPEQAELSKLDVDTRSDIYSLGVLLYELLTGTTPFTAKRLRSLGYGEMQRVILEEEPERPSTRLSTLAVEAKQILERSCGEDSEMLRQMLVGDLDWIVMKCLEKDRQRRYETATGLARDILRHLHNEPVIARPPDAVYRFQKFVRRNKAAFAATIAASTALILGLVIAIAGWRETQKERDISIQARRVAEAARAAEIAQRTLAESATASEALLRRKAEAQELVARRHAYASDMRLAQQELEANNLRQARQLIDRWRPKPGELDLRGWEWRYLWSLTRGDFSSKLMQSKGRIIAFGFPSISNQLAVAEDNGRLSIWDMKAGIELNELQYPLFSSPQEGVCAASYSDGGRFLMVSIPHRDGRTWRIWDLYHKKILWERQLERKRSCHISPDGSIVVIHTQPNDAELWSTIENRLLRKLELGGYKSNPGSAEVTVLKLSSDRSWLGIGDDQGWVSIISVLDGHQIARFRASTHNFVSGIRFAPDKSIVLVTCWFGEVESTVWNPLNGERLGSFKGHQGYVRKMSTSTDARLLATCSGDQTLKIWDFKLRKELATLKGHEDEVWDVQFTPDGEHLVSGGKDGSVYVWPVSFSRNGKISEEQKLGETWDLGFSPDGRKYAVMKMDGNVRVCSNPGGEVIGEAGVGDAKSSGLLFVSDNELLIWSSKPPSVKFFHSGSHAIREYRHSATNYLYLLARDNVRGAPVAFCLDHQNKRVEMWAWNSSSNSLLLVRDFQSPDLEDVKGRYTKVGLSFESDRALLGILTPHGMSVWDTQTDHEVGAFPVSYRDVPNGMTLFPKRSLVAFATTDKPGAQVWDWREKRKIADLLGHNGVVGEVLNFENERRLLTSSIAAEPMKIWDTSSWEALLTLPNPGVQFVPVNVLGDGRTITALDLNGDLHRWSAPTWDEITANEKSAVARIQGQ